jgi:hypothetical protein
MDAATCHVRDFERELEVFRHEVEAATQLFYAYLAVHASMGAHKKVEDLLNEAPLFWKSCLYGLQASTFIVLARVFDQNQKSQHNLDRLIKIAQERLDIFSKGELGKRKQGNSPHRPEWLDEYLEKVYVPTAKDFRQIRKRIATWRRTYEKNYRPIRDKVYAHRGVTGDRVEALWAQTRIRELQLLLKFLRQLHEALWELFHNGWKPVLRPQRYSLRSIRDRPSEAGRINDVQERVVFEAEKFLRMCSGLPPPRRARRGRFPLDE